MNLLKNKISHEQRKKIFAMSRQAGINNEELHSLIKEWANVNSLSSELCSSSQANKIISSLESVINKRKISYAPVKSPPIGPTEKQIYAINTLKRILKWNDARVSGFMKHTVDKSAIENLSVIDASKVIMGLRKMIPAKPPNSLPHYKNGVISNS